MMNLISAKSRVSRLRRWRYRDASFVHFDTITVCDGQRQTGERTDIWMDIFECSNTVTPVLDCTGKELILDEVMPKS